MSDLVIARYDVEPSGPPKSPLKWVARSSFIGGGPVTDVVRLLKKPSAKRVT